MRKVPPRSWCFSRHTLGPRWGMPRTGPRRRVHRTQKLQVLPALRTCADLRPAELGRRQWRACQLQARKPEGLTTRSRRRRQSQEREGERQTLLYGIRDERMASQRRTWCPEGKKKAPQVCQRPQMAAFPFAQGPAARDSKDKMVELGHLQRGGLLVGLHPTVIVLPLDQAVAA